MKNLINLLLASDREKSEIYEGNLFKEIGFEGENARLGWVTPPKWEKIEQFLTMFQNLDLTRNKTDFIFSGMGGSINAVKALTSIQKNENGVKIHIIDSLDPAALSELFSNVASWENAIVVSISKSGSTRETLEILKALNEKFESLRLDPSDHFLWLTDLNNKDKLKTGYNKAISIQLNGATDIGGRFSAPHTAIFLIPLYLVLNDLDQLKKVWLEYLRQRETLLDVIAQRANYLASMNVQRFALVFPRDIAQALDTWSTQLIQESLGSKSDNFNPKTIVLSDGETVPTGFESIQLNVNSPVNIVNLMVSMYLLEVFAAIFAYEQRINFVNQPAVDLYKREMSAVKSENLLENEFITYNDLVSMIKKKILLIPGIKFIEVVCYWHSIGLKEKLSIKIRQNFPELDVLVFSGSDWNHHSYQAASKNQDTLYLILIKHAYEHNIDGVSDLTLRNNAMTLQKIAIATQRTLSEKAILARVDEQNLTS